MAIPRIQVDKAIQALPGGFTLTIQAGTGGTTSPAPGTYNYYSSGSQAQVTAIPSTNYVLAIEGGALYKIKSGKIMPYVGAGLGYYMYKETNQPIGEAKKSNIGFCVVGGASMRVLKSLALDCRIKYSTCSMQPADFKVNIGGLTFGLGLGLGF